jgi:predicted NBD/HSP70 family sugar kinase
VGHILAVLRADGPLTRQELQSRIGLSRVTLTERLDVLNQLGLVRQTGHRASSGGRPAQILAANDVGFGALVIDIGQRHATLAVVDLAGNLFATQEITLPMGHLPGDTLPMLLATGQRLLAETEQTDRLCAVGVSVPGQLDQHSGTTVAPPTMPSWREVPLRAPFEDALGVRVILENDANALAFGAYCGLNRPHAALVGVKVGTGIGAGVVIDGRLHRGETGCAGEIGHIRIEGAEQRCACGRTGCVAALASGQAIIRQLRPAGVRSNADIVRRVQSGDPETVRVTASAGRLVGSVLATVVTIVNPRYVRVGGEIGELEPFVDALRESVLAGAHTSAVDGLSVAACPPEPNCTLVGLAGLVADQMLAPATVNALARAAGRDPGAHRRAAAAPSPPGESPGTS